MLTEKCGNVRKACENLSSANQCFCFQPWELLHTRVGGDRSHVKLQLGYITV
jgi:hypothetical protein